MPGTYDATDEERYALLAMIEHQCTCPKNAVGNCPAHLIMRDAQRIKWLLFVRRTMSEWQGAYRRGA